MNEKEMYAIGFNKVRSSSHAKELIELVDKLSSYIKENKLEHIFAFGVGISGLQITCVDIMEYVSPELLKLLNEMKTGSLQEKLGRIALSLTETLKLQMENELLATFSNREVDKLAKQVTVFESDPEKILDSFIIEVDKHRGICKELVMKYAPICVATFPDETGIKFCAHSIIWWQ